MGLHFRNSKDFTLLLKLKILENFPAMHLQVKIKKPFASKSNIQFKITDIFHKICFHTGFREEKMIKLLGKTLIQVVVVTLSLSNQSYIFYQKFFIIKSTPTFLMIF